MLTVTEQAKQILLEKKRSANVQAAEVGLRVTPDGSGGLGLVADRPGQGDHVVEHDGSTVLVVAPELAAQLSGLRLECRERPGGQTDLVLVPGAVDADGPGPQ